MPSIAVRPDSLFGITRCALRAVFVVLIAQMDVVYFYHTRLCGEESRATVGTVVPYGRR